MFKHFFFKAQDDDVEDMMEYATSGEFVLHCISVESYFFNHKMFRKSLVSLVSFFMEC